MTDFLSEDHIRAHCPFCEPTHLAYTYLLTETKHFRVVADYNPLAEGHLLIIPKRHVACVGRYDAEEYAECTELSTRIRAFVRDTYGTESTFEHGVIGQTVFHSHVHVVPFGGTSSDIIPEGAAYIMSIIGFGDVRGRERYLFFSIDDSAWLVDESLGGPRFFRDRFARALGVPERGEWKKIQDNPEWRARFETENRAVQKKWAAYTER